MTDATKRGWVWHWQTNSDWARDTAGVSPVWQLALMAYFKARLGTSGQEFYDYELFDRSRPLSERLKTMSTTRRFRLETVLNPHRGRVLVDNKTVFGAYLGQLGIPTPEILGVFDPATGMTATGGPLRTTDDLARLLAPGFPTGIVFKDEVGKKGESVFVFDSATAGELVRPGGERWPLERLAGALKAAATTRFLVQRRAHNHPAIVPLAGGSLMTIRVVSYLTNRGARLLRATARIPRHDEGIDNFSADNLAAPVDLASGRLGLACSWQQRERLAVHPTRGTAIEGFEVPRWAEVRDVVMRAATLMLPLRTLGWDVGVTEAGPTVVESNRAWGVTVVQRPHRTGLWEGEFKAWCESELARYPWYELWARRLLRRF